jgi:hypothetical protein
MVKSVQSQRRLWIGLWAVGWGASTSCSICASWSSWGGGVEAAAASAAGWVAADECNTGIGVCAGVGAGVCLSSGSGSGSGSGAGIGAGCGIGFSRGAGVAMAVVGCTRVTADVGATGVGATFDVAGSGDAGGCFLVAAAVSAGGGVCGWGGSSTRCSNALKVPKQRPQRTLPRAALSCSLATRKQVSQWGQCVYIYVPCCG